MKLMFKCSSGVTFNFASGTSFFLITNNINYHTYPNFTSGNDHILQVTTSNAKICEKQKQKRERERERDKKLHLELSHESGA